MAKRKTRAMLEAELTKALADLANAEQEIRTIREMNIELGELVDEMRTTIATKDSLARERDLMLQNRRQKVNDLTAEIDKAREDTRYWKGQYQNADDWAVTVEKAAMLVAIPLAQNTKAPEMIASVNHNARVAGIDMTDKAKTAVVKALSAAAAIVLENAMNRQEERAAPTDPLAAIRQFLSVDRD